MILLSEAIHIYLKSDKQGALSAKTICQKKQILQKIDCFYLEKLKLETLLSLINQWNYLSSSTRQNYISILRSFLSFFRLNQLAKQLPKVKRTLSKLRFIPGEKTFLESLENLPKSECKTLVYLLYSCGLRISEALNLKIHDLDLLKGELLIQNPKNKQDRLIPIPSYAIQKLKRHEIKSDYIFQLSYTKIALFIRKYLNCKVHDLRHYIAVHLLENGASIRYVSKFLGHCSLKSTTIYSRYLNKSFHQNYRNYHPRTDYETK